MTGLESGEPGGQLGQGLQPQQAPGQRSVHAVRGVSLTAYRGEAIGLIRSILPL